MSIAGTSAIRRLEDVAVVAEGLDEITPVGRRAPGRRDQRRLERIAGSLEDFPDRPWLGCKAISRISYPHPLGTAEKTPPPLGPSVCPRYLREVSCVKVVRADTGPGASQPVQESLASREIVAEVPLAGLSFFFRRHS